jgi:hypothetical protein
MMATCWCPPQTEEHKTGSHLELFQVSEVGSTVYESVGAVSGKITLKGSISGSVKAKIQKKSQDKAQQKKDSAATQLEGGGSSSKKKRSAVSEPIGAQSPKRIKEAGKDASLKVAVDTMSEMEKKDKVLHSLAVRDMSKADLRARIGNRDIPRAILQEYATWDPQKSRPPPESLQHTRQPIQSNVLVPCQQPPPPPPSAACNKPVIFPICCSLELRSWRGNRRKGRFNSQ